MRKLDIQETLFNLYRAHYQKIDDWEKTDLTFLSSFVGGYYSTSTYTRTLEEELRISEKANIHSKRSEHLRAMKSIYDWIISPTPENLSALLNNIAETEGDSFNSIYAFWEKYSPVLLDFGPILLRYQLENALERTKEKKDIKNIAELIFSYPDKRLHEDALTRLAKWEKYRTSA